METSMNDIRGKIECIVLLNASEIDLLEKELETTTNIQEQYNRLT